MARQVPKAIETQAPPSPLALYLATCLDKWTQSHASTKTPCTVRDVLDALEIIRYTVTEEFVAKNPGKPWTPKKSSDA